jgi:hypothetical protein
VPRIRSIKPELWQHPEVGELTHGARLTFVGLITQADDEGRLRGDLPLIRATIFPFDAEVGEAQLDDWLGEVEQAGHILRYEVNARPYISLIGWGEHQKISHPATSKLPKPPRKLRSGSRTFRRDSGAPLKSVPTIKDQGSGIRNGSDQGRDLTVRGIDVGGAA